MKLMMMENDDPSVAMSSPQASDLERADAIELARWRALSARRLTLLVTAEHDVSILRDRLDMLQCEQQVLMRERQALLRERGEQFLRMRQLENELSVVLSSRSWRLTAPLRNASRGRVRGKAVLRAMLRRLIMLRVARPIVRTVVRLFPGLSLRLRARLHAH